MGSVRCAHRGLKGTAGFTLFEAVMVLVIVATVVGALTPSVMRQLSRARVNRAATIVAAEFLQAQTLAGRQRKPIVVSFDVVNRIIFVTDAATTSNISLRRLGADSEFRLTSLTATYGNVFIMPNGMANNAVTVTVEAAGYTRQVRLTRAGQVRIL